VYAVELRSCGAVNVSIWGIFTTHSTSTKNMSSGPLWSDQWLNHHDWPETLEFNQSPHFSLVNLWRTPRAEKSSEYSKARQTYATSSAPGRLSKNNEILHRGYRIALTTLWTFHPVHMSSDMHRNGKEDNAADICKVNVCLWHLIRKSPPRLLLLPRELRTPPVHAVSTCTGYTQKEHTSVE